MTLLVALHALAAVFWVGGMAFAYLALRPAAAALEAPARLALWHRVLGRFLPLVWAAVAVLLASGYAMLVLGFGGFGGAGAHIHLMQATGIVMVLLFLHLFFAPWRRFRAAVEAADWPQAARHLDRIRRIVGVNLLLGIATVAVGASGRYW